MQQQSTRADTTAATVSGFTGIGLYLVVGFFYLTSGLVVPVPWLFVLWAIWVAGAYPLVRVFRTRRGWTPLVAGAAAFVLWLYVAVGGAALGWTA